jgi:chorismate dehydratase
LKRPWRLGVVSFLNARPLIEGLDTDPDFELTFAVPSRLADLLEQNEVDAALIPVIDLLHKERSWQVLSDACIGCDGETYTVRIFSRIPPAAIRTLHVDGDSHTSVALARIIWQERYGVKLNIEPVSDVCSAGSCEAILLIGDKVVHHELRHHEIETDLGSEWKSLTSLPFVFAVWAAPSNAGCELTELAHRLSAARRAGVASAELIAADFGPGLGWPVTLAKRYLTQRLKYELGPRQRSGMERFLELAKTHGLVPDTKELVFA